MAEANFTYYASGDVEKQGVLRLEDYQEAADHGMSVAQFINNKYPDADRKKYGTAFEQGMQSVGIYTKSDPEHGIQPSKMKDVLNGDALKIRMAGEGLSSGGGIVAPSTQGTTPASRVFFPEVVMQFMNEVLQEDYSLEGRIWDAMIGSKENIPSEMFTQPLINIEAPKAEDSAPISQNSLPKTLVSITTSQVSKSIATNSVGLQISDQAIQHASIDLVGTIFAQQARGENLRKMWADIAAVIAGNVDAGEIALTPGSIGASGALSQTDWITYLYDPSRTITIDSIICSIATYLKIQGRTGRPVTYDPNTSGSNVGNLGTYGLNVEPNLLNVSLGVPNVMIVPSTVVADDTILGFDSRFALRKVTNVNASYSATERMVLQRSNFFRFDWGQLTYRLFDTAFKPVSIAA